MEKKTERKATLYGVQFSGLFGRNRSVKFKASRTLVERPEGAEEGVFCAGLAGDFCLELKVKYGVVSVLAYDDSGIERYTDEATGKSFEIQVWQPFSARRVVKQEIAKPEGK